MEQGCLSGERSSFLPLCPAFESRTRRHLLIGLFVLRSVPRGISPCTPAYFAAFSSDLNWVDKYWSALIRFDSHSPYLVYHLYWARYPWDYYHYRRRYHHDLVAQSLLHDFTPARSLSANPWRGILADSTFATLPLNVLCLRKQGFVNFSNCIELSWIWSSCEHWDRPQGIYYHFCSLVSSQSRTTVSPPNRRRSCQVSDVAYYLRCIHLLYE